MKRWASLVVDCHQLLVDKNQNYERFCIVIEDLKQIKSLTEIDAVQKVVDQGTVVETFEVDLQTLVNTEDGIIDLEAM